MSGIRTITAPTEEPIELDEMKDYLKVDTDTEDGLILDLISVAREYAEKYMRRAIMTQTILYSLDGVPVDYDNSNLPSDWPWSLVPAGKGFIELPRPQLQSVTAVKYYDTANTEHTFSTANYYVDTYADVGRVALNLGCVWPSELRSVDSIRIEYVAGYSSIVDVPMQIKSGIKRAVAYWYQNRGDVDVPIDILRLWAPYRILRL